MFSIYDYFTLIYIWHADVILFNTDIYQAIQMIK